MALPNDKRLLLKVAREWCEEHGVELHAGSQDWVLRLTKNGTAKYIWGYDFPLNLAPAHLIAKDKSATYDMLTLAHIPALPHHIFIDPTTEYAYATEEENSLEIHNLFLQYDKCVVLKDNFGTGGSGCVRVTTQETLEKEVANLFLKTYALALSPFVTIQSEYRVIVLDDTVLLTFEKIPQEQPESTFIMHNLCHGTRAHLVEDSALSELAIRTMRALNLRIASVDIIRVKDTLQVLEVNAGIMVEYMALQSEELHKKATAVYRAALDAIFKEMVADTSKS